MQTRPCNLDLLYSKTRVNRGIHFFLIFALKHRSWVLVNSVIDIEIFTKI